MAGSYVSQAGLDKMVEELRHLESVERPAISRAIAEARDKGDLSENAEYDAAKEAQGLLESRISLLKEKIAGAIVIDESKLTTDKVQILTKVQLKNTKNGLFLQQTYRYARLFRKALDIDFPRQRRTDLREHRDARFHGA